MLIFFLFACFPKGWLAERLYDEIQGLLHLQKLALSDAYSNQRILREVQERMLNKLGSPAPPRLQVVELDSTTWRVDDQGHWAPII